MIVSASLRMLVLLSLLLFSGWARAESFPKPGSYSLQTEGKHDDSGELKIEKAKDGTLAFSFDTLNDRGYTCSPQGTIRQGRAVLKTDGQEDCIITFEKGKKGGILVEATTPSCRAFCGTNGHFDGLYQPD